MSLILQLVVTENCRLQKWAECEALTSREGYCQVRDQSVRFAKRAHHQRMAAEISALARAFYEEARERGLL